MITVTKTPNPMTKTIEFRVQVDEATMLELGTFNSLNMSLLSNQLYALSVIASEKERSAMKGAKEKDTNNYADEYESTTRKTTKK